MKQRGKTERGGATTADTKEIYSTKDTTKGMADRYNDVSSWPVKGAVTGCLRSGET